MKRVRCPKCDGYVAFDETRYTQGQSLVFECPQCGKQFSIRLGASKLRPLQKDEAPDDSAGTWGSIVVIEITSKYYH